ncbi:hypothetical protein [Ligilactobacillus murinus]|uniref:Uncharacterized protein n=1 Tax=Ligilactobacillus murinus TaxID=1622 RepID=A0AAE6WHZ5_9LACO|nr:hypothetical protein [Ligilactobacillus murinus]NEF82747.1 hypothetical protein [Ligilactobacillus murinus]NEF84305.1 hypothetical protein [Ligilactobacillus murinus]NEF87299.1 hypothetical protein [Ligilactobacillus murinus]NEF89633.1 hypothetical protein [Ligilactobacillus murinus]NEF91885.1 hypothetical protein [Ligilactobacillus murinus]
MPNKFSEINNVEHYELTNRLDKKTQLKPMFNGKKTETISTSISKRNAAYLNKLVEETGAKSRTSVLETLIDIYYDKLIGNKNS